VLVAQRIETSEYRISRSQLVYWSANEYIRRFWPGFIAFPIMGIILFIAMPTQVGIGLGMLLILWPMSIPARSILLTGRAAKRVLSPTRMVAEGEHLYFIVNPLEMNYRVNIKSVRDIVVRKEYIVVELWKFKMIFVPITSLNGKNSIKELRAFTEVES
jgi:hypothetical protein